MCKLEKVKYGNIGFNIGFFFFTVSLNLRDYFVKLRRIFCNYSDKLGWRIV